MAVWAPGRKGSLFSGPGTSGSGAPRLRALVSALPPSGKLRSSVKPKPTWANSDLRGSLRPLGSAPERVVGVPGTPDRTPNHVVGQALAHAARLPSRSGASAGLGTGTSAESQSRATGARLLPGVCGAPVPDPAPPRGLRAPYRSVPGGWRRGGPGGCHPPGARRLSHPGPQRPARAKRLRAGTRARERVAAPPRAPSPADLARPAPPPVAPVRGAAQVRGPPAGSRSPALTVPSDGR